jgi:hypothetical protein
LAGAGSQARVQAGLGIFSIPGEAGKTEEERVIRHNGIEIDNDSRAIRIGEYVRKFKSSKGKDIRFTAIKHLLLCGPNGASRDDLWNLCYGHCYNGGPNAGLQYFDILFHQMRPKIKAMGLDFTKEKRSGTQYYRLIRI